MAGVPARVLDWLTQILANNYNDLQRTYRDVVQALESYPGFSVRTDVYTYENGSSELLLIISGTLPVTFRGAQYGFPVALWVPRAYPLLAPMAFVMPSRDMAVRPGQHVSLEGKVYHPYLAGWSPEASTILQLCRTLQDIFAREPPLLATQAPRQPSRTEGPTLHGAGDSRLPAYRVSSGQANGSTGPAPPPKPGKVQQSAESKYDRPPPLPNEQSVAPAPVGQPLSAGGSAERYGCAEAQQPAAYGSSNFQHLQQRRPPNTQTQPPSWSPEPGRLPDMAAPAYSQHASPLPPIAPAYQQPTPGYDPRHSYSAQPSAHPPHPQASAQQLPPQRPASFQQPPPPPTPTKKPQEDLLTSPFEPTVPMTSSVVVAPPPIPPNPEKDALLSALSENLTQQIQTTHSNNVAAIPPLRAQQAALTSTLNNINREIEQLDTLDEMLTSNESILHQAMRDADQVLKDAKTRKVPEVDDVLVPPIVVARQLYETVADLHASEDARGVLAKALDSGRISSAVWAKQTRSLAREEFLKKALIKKIARGMGLAEEGSWAATSPPPAAATTSMS